MAELLALEAFYAIASAGFAISTTTYVAVTVASYAIVAAGVYAVSNALVKKPSFGNLSTETSGKVTMTRDTIASRRVVYGINRVSGPIVFASTNSSNFSGKNEFLHMVIALAGHEITDVKNVFFNDVVAWDSGSGQSATFPADKLALTYKIGSDSQTAYVMTPATEWDSDCVLNGIASVYVKLVADPAVYPNGIPNISATIVGYTLQDVNGSNVDYFDNPALILLHYLKNYFGVSSDEIDSSSFETARDVCNYEPYGSGTGKRYTCNYTFTLNSKPSKIIEDILKSCYGKLAYSDGKFILKAGAYSTPTVYLNEDDLIGGITVTTKASQANSFNSVRGLYIDGAPSNVDNSAYQPDSFYTSSYQGADFVPVTSSFYLNEDNDIESQIDIELPSVSDHTVARRLAKLTLLDSRQDLAVSITTKISGLQLIAGDNVYLSVARYGWVNKVFEVNELTINPDLSISLVLKETDSAIYDYPIEEDVDRDLSPNTNLPSPFIVIPPVGFNVTESTTVDKDGTVFPSATLIWSSSFSGSISDVSLEFKNTSSADFDGLGTVSRTDNTFTTLDVIAGNTYEFRARNLNYLGVYSAYVSKSLKIVGDNTPPQTPSSITATGGSGSFTLNWTNSSLDTDYNFTRIWLNTVDNFSTSTFQGSISGTTWNKLITITGSYYSWLQNVDTSNNSSSLSAPVNAVVAGITATGVAGPSGSNGDTNYVIYRRSPVVPALNRTENLVPTGWSETIPPDDGQSLWISNGLISGDDGVTIIGLWSEPQRLIGTISYYADEPPVSGSNASPVDGDIWFDTNDGYKIYRWSSGSISWQSVQDLAIPSISAGVTASFTTSALYSASLASTANANSASLASAIVFNSSSFSTSLNQTNSTVTANSSSAAASISTVGAAVTTNSSSFAATISTLDSKVNTNSASLASSITTTNGAVTTNSSSFAISINALNSAVVTNSSSFASALTTTNTTVATNSSSAALSITTVDSRVTTTSSSLAASITTTNGTVTTNSSSAAISINNLASTVSTNSASLASSITSTNSTVTTNSSSAATSINTLSSTVTSNSSSAAASVTTVASAVSSVSGSLNASFVLNVTAGNRVAGFRTGVGGTVSNSSFFTIEADKLEFVNTSGTGPTRPFFIEAGSVFMDGLIVKNIQAGYISAGTINAAVKLTAARLESPEITGSGFMINSGNGMRYQNNNGNFIITGGSANGESNGAQIDLVGVGGGTTGTRGVLALSAGNVGTTDGDGTIRFRTAGTEQAKLKRDGTFEINHSVSTNGFKGNHIRFGASSGNTDRAISANFDNDAALTYAGGTGITGVLTSNEAHRWVNSGNSQELMALTTGGNLHVQTDVYADNFISPSSAKLKSNIVELKTGLSIVNQLRPVSFTWKYKNNNADTGFIAEEVEKIIPHIVSYSNNEVSGIDYSKVVPYLVAAIQEQQKIIENLRNRITVIERR